jgi:hypothetical protein
MKDNEGIGEALAVFSFREKVVDAGFVISLTLIVPLSSFLTRYLVISLGGITKRTVPYKAPSQFGMGSLQRMN